MSPRGGLYPPSTAAVQSVLFARVGGYRCPISEGASSAFAQLDQAISPKQPQPALPQPARPRPIVTRARFYAFAPERLPVPASSRSPRSADPGPLPDLTIPPGALRTPCILRNDPPASSQAPC